MAEKKKKMKAMVMRVSERDVVKEEEEKKMKEDPTKEKNEQLECQTFEEEESRHDAGPKDDLTSSVCRRVSCGD